MFFNFNCTMLFLKNKKWVFCIFPLGYVKNGSFCYWTFRLEYFYIVIFLIGYCIVVCYFQGKISVYLFNIIVLFFIFALRGLRLKKTMEKRQVCMNFYTNSKWGEKQWKLLPISTMHLAKGHLCGDEEGHGEDSVIDNEKLKAWFKANPLTTIWELDSSNLTVCPQPFKRNCLKSCITETAIYFWNTI